MPHDREASRDRELVLKHQHSFSDSISSRSSVSIPMWDSSDPDRAPPPLPLNPVVGAPVTKGSTSANVAAAAEAIANRMRESQHTSNNSSPTKSSEKSLIKGHHHKRLQSMNNGNVKDLSSYLENGRPPERSPERSPERVRSSTNVDRCENKTATRGSESRSETPTPMSRGLDKDIPELRTSARPPLKAILGEDPPQSATMRALRGKSRDDRDSTPPSPSAKRDTMALVRTPQSIDAISSQIVSLTTIATNLQQEMAQLSRRSRDNATDLVSLKEATNSRDEDIRKTLRELVVNLKTQNDEIEVSRKAVPRHSARSHNDDRPLYSPSTPKTISIPRIPSPASFAASIDRDMVSSPTPYNSDGAASIALLEKIFREMGTREGQEHISEAIIDLATKGSTRTSSPEVLQKLEEIVRMLRENPQSTAMIRVEQPQQQSTSKAADTTSYDYSLHPAVALARAGRGVSAGAVPLATGNSSGDTNASITPVLINDDMARLIKRIKDSVTESGGLTNEVKALVRELRGEVLGMGREIGRKLDTVEKARDSGSDNASKSQVLEVVEEGLLQLKKHMDEVLREHRRSSAASAVSRTAIDTKEVYATVQSALRDIQLDQLQQRAPAIERDDILNAVREAWETYKPEIEVTSSGLEHDEILECLEKGLQDYRNQVPEHSSGATYEDILGAVKQGLQDFKPPQIDTEASVTRDEIITTMRECLESFDIPSRSIGPNFERNEIMDAVKEALLLHAAALSRDSSVSREDLLDAVRDGFINHEPPLREMEINRDDLFDAVRAGLQEAPTNEANEEMLNKMQDLIDSMRDEFQRQGPAGDGDNEQVLDAMKDGLESLRANIETYVDRASDVTGKDEIIETIKDSVDNLRADLESSISNIRGPAPTTSTELLDVMEKEFEHLQTTLVSSLARGEGSIGGREELLDALREGFDELKASSGSFKDPAGIEDELKHLRETIAATMTRSGGGIDREEILEAIRESMNNSQLDNKPDRPESIRSSGGELLDAFHEGLDKLKLDIEQVVSKDGIELIRNDIERVVAEISRPVDMTINYEILDLLKEGLTAVQSDVAKLLKQQESTSERGGEVVVADEETGKSTSSPAIQNLEVMLTQLKMKVDALDNQAPAMDHMALRPDFDNLETMVKNLQDTVQNMNETREENAGAPATKDDIEAIETILLNSKAKLDDLSMPDTNDLAKASQLEALEILVKDLSHALDDLTLRQEDNLPSKVEFGSLETTVKGLKDKLEDLSVKLSDDGAQRADMESLEALCIETQNQLKELIPEGGKLASSAAVTDLQTLVKDLHDQSQEFHDKIIQEAEMTAQAFESRKIEHGGLADKIEDVKAFLENIRMELKSKIESGGQGIESLALTLTTIGEALTAANAVESLKEMKDLLEIKLADIQEEQSTGLEAHREALTQTQAAHKAAFVEEVSTKLDIRFDELMAKYEELEASNTEQSASFAEKSRDSIDAILSTKAITDDLKLLVDTLGHTVTEACNNMAEDSKTVFTKVEELGVRQDVGFSSLATEMKEDHQLTRTDVAKASSTIDSVYSLVAEHNPKVMEAIHDVLNVMSQHFEMAQKSTEEIKSTVKEIPNSISLPALPAPVSSPVEERSYFPEKYDDTEVHTKLDKLVGLAAEVGKSAVEFEILEQIKSQVTATASDFDAFVRSQAVLTAERDQVRNREAEEVGIALEKRLAQKQAIEGEIVTLNSTKEELQESIDEYKQSVASLKQDEKDMLSLKAKLQAELSSLETALQIRKEEMHIMEDRAEKLEKRILDSVLDQSRSVLLGSRPGSSLNVMNLKRVPSVNSQATETTRRSTRAGPVSKLPGTTASAALGSAVGKTLKRRQAPSTNASPAGSIRADRRILSLSTISGNKGTGLSDSKSIHKSSLGAAFGALKRSHSVKSSLPSRTTSWSHTKQLGLGNQVSALDKENSVLEEEEESSDAGTERRSSYTGTYDGTDIGSKSYITASVTDSLASDSRRTSYANSSVAGTMDVSEREDDIEQVNPGEELAIHTDLADDKHMVVYEKDSGIGSEPPTATLENRGNFFGH